MPASSNANRKFNDRGDRDLITTQSIKKLQKHLKEWALDPMDGVLQMLQMPMIVHCSSVMPSRCLKRKERDIKKSPFIIKGKY